jgi:putative membrane protein
MTANGLFYPSPFGAGVFLCLCQFGQGRDGRTICRHLHAYHAAMLWIKAFHILFVASWFAGLFYLPRIFVNLADVQADSHAERERLLLMARRLFRFMTLLALPAIGLGLWMWLGYRDAWVGGWLHAKLTLVVLVIGYHHACWSILKKFELAANRRSARWFRVFNEVAVLLFGAIVVLVVVKPF